MIKDPYLFQVTMFTQEQFKALQEENFKVYHEKAVLEGHVAYFKVENRKLENRLKMANTEKENELVTQRKEYERFVDELSVTINFNNELTEKVKVLDSNNKELKQQNAELSMKLDVLETDGLKKKEEKSEDIEKLVKQIKSLQNDLNESESNCQDHLMKRQVLEKRNIMLSKQVSDFEKIVIVERNRFEKRREESDKEILELQKKIFELQKNMEDKRTKLSEEKNGVENKFEEERKIFESEIKKLTSKLSGLSTDMMKEQRTKSDLQMKVNLIDAKRNKLIAKVKELEDLLKSRFSRADSYSKNNQMGPSNLFYNYSENSSGNIHYKKGNNFFVPNSNVKKNNTFKDKSFVKPDIVYSRSDLIRLSQKKTYGSYMGMNDFIRQDYIDERFGTYKISFYKSSTLNKQGPKFHWVPKSV